MSTITLHDASENQLNLIKNLLKELKIKFEISDRSEELNDWQKKLIDEGSEDFFKGNFSSIDEVRRKARLCLK